MVPAKLLILMVPRGGVNKLNQINSLRRGGALSCLVVSLSFSASMSHPFVVFSVLYTP